MQIEFGFECKMVKFGVAFEQFKFDIAAYGSKEVIRLGRHGLGW